ncbi:hypothetical protein F5890DRAFT_754463 [Lentinula detonsa]|uniref:Uncharacterized protein n=1 Tax=Lentinula detonsa TaxID=2804962 RepID=A0AA38UWK7_9AGAR|nr:hypothetical protein F5890DRAFT_754463 [Lentinula detonsa]
MVILLDAGRIKGTKLRVCDIRFTVAHIAVAFDSLLSLFEVLLPAGFQYSAVERGERITLRSNPHVLIYAQFLLYFLPLVNYPFALSFGEGEALLVADTSHKKNLGSFHCSRSIGFRISLAI